MEQEYLNIPYTLTDPPDTLRSLDLHVPPGAQPSRGLVVYVHGGAWRSEDKRDHVKLARTLALATRCPVAVPNYRLTTAHTPQICWPSHSVDILGALTFLRTWSGPPDLPAGTYEPSKMFLVGHSCGAHILASIFLQPSPHVRELDTSIDLLTAVQAVVGSEGLYDMDALLRSFPSYREWFVEAALGPPSAEVGYTALSPSSYGLREGGHHVRWLITHSRGDTLVDELQSRVIYDHLRALYHPEPERVGKDFTTSKEEHHVVIRSAPFVELVSGYFNGLLEQ